MKEFVGGCSSLVPLFLGGKDSTLPFPIAFLLTHTPNHPPKQFVSSPREKRRKKVQVPIQHAGVEEKYSNNILEDFSVLSLFIPDILQYSASVSTANHLIHSRKQYKKRQSKLKYNFRLVT